MNKAPNLRCRACGQALTADETICPRCNVARKGDANRPMIAAYGFFLFLMLVLGTATILYLRRTTNLP